MMAFYSSNTIKRLDKRLLDAFFISVVPHFHIKLPFLLRQFRTRTEKFPVGSRSVIILCIKENGEDFSLFFTKNR